jgi:hypothetical protein
MDGTIVALRGWGAVARGWPVRVELRDPGVLAVVRSGYVRSRDAFTFDITELALGLTARQLSRGGGFVGGGFGITGLVKGALIAKAMNAMTERHWEETRLHLTQHLPVGTRRSITLSLPGHTPTSLAQVMRPALDGWANEWVQATLAGRLRPFTDTQNLTSVYAQIDAIHQRMMITAADAQALCSHHTQPLLAALHTRLLAGEVTYREAQDITAEVEQLLADHRITQQQAQPLRALLAKIPTPATRAQREQAREELIRQLRTLRATGAITEHELQTELTRLRRS